MLPDDEVEVDPTESERINALCELDAEDLEFLEPPTSIWKAISATVDAEATQPASLAPSLGSVIPTRSRLHTALMPTTVISMGDGWSDFARDNGAPELAELTGTQTPGSPAATPAAVFGR